MPTLTPISHISTFTTTQLCNPATNFTYMQNGSASVCVRLSTEVMNYTSARKACQEYGGNLYTMKTQEKINIFKKLADAGNYQIWLGLDDLETEDVFKWVDDGSVLNSSWRDVLFPVIKPDNAFTGEDCISYNYFFSKSLNDGDCSLLMNFMCEMVMFTA
ncbi:CD209 antigen-like protein 2 [Physella acuta]|uniref:CD209 antigen-like protein 2 n=1 Tax=Physella acuta TaxID=109671 RepID=UPI0027DDCC12|nr:CD209 antigen-like protein 2 [Physella acuta]